MVTEILRMHFDCSKERPTLYPFHIWDKFFLRVTDGYGPVATVRFR